jgi:hypothetical protein
METDNVQELNVIQLRQEKEKKTIIEQLRKTPIIQIACERASVSRATFYRWRDQDKEFEKAVKEALVEGEVFINELSESQLISLIKEKNWPAISFWLRNHDPKYTQRIEISTTQPQEKLNPEQEAVVKEALRLAGITAPEEKIVDGKEENIILINNQNNGEKNSKQQTTGKPTSEPEQPCAKTNTGANTEPKSDTGQTKTKPTALTT